MDKIGKLVWIFTLMFAVSLSFNLILLHTFYDGLRNMLLGYGYVSYVNMNSINEFWIEFVFLHIGIILISVGVFKGWKIIIHLKEY